MRVYWDTVNFFRVRLMVNCKENHLKTLASVSENHLMTYCFGQPEGLESLVRFAKNLWEEFLFEVLLGLNFSCQPTTGLSNKDTQRRLVP